MCIQNLVKFRQLIVKILSKNQILPSIKGCNTFAYSRKMTLYYTNVDRININAYTKFGLIPSIHCQDIEQKPKEDGMTERWIDRVNPVLPHFFQSGAIKSTRDRSKRIFILHFSIDFHIGSTSPSARQHSFTV